ncbi:DUF2066 domain-containing protein [Kiloniella laminariae]|uniref:DUF2066 domain-containing protein n=2 Tax=Bacteria TaxID=2 RepID=A0ABT4LGZ6_9PROT|nr:DUF2066 domain-containing protein [Kiloniella laminariae]MCZ4280367.1 DUF2066 domain-containing protein [Kiloniella laminariae]
MRFRRFFYTVGILVSFFVLTSGLFAGAAQAVPEVYTVRNITVDATAKSASDAKAEALSQGYEKAFQILVERLVPQSDLGKVPRLSSKDALGYVLDISLSEERSSAVRYIAKMTVRFKESQTRTLLRNTGAALAETISKPVLVLPIQNRGGESLLWGDRNDWRLAWSGLEDSNGLVPLTLPLGDLEDISFVDAKGALKGQPGLWELSARYGSSDVFISVADLSEDGNSAKVSAVRVGQFGEGRTYRLDVKRSENETTGQMLQRAAQSLDRMLQQDWKQENLLQFGVERWILVQIPIDGLQDWVLINNRLQDIPAINRMNTRTLKRDMVNLDVYFVGDERQLTLALAQKDLALLLNAQSLWELRLLNKPASSQTLSLPGPGTSVPAQNEAVIDEIVVPDSEINLENAQ